MVAWDAGHLCRCGLDPARLIASGDSTTSDGLAGTLAVGGSEAGGANAGGVGAVPTARGAPPR